MLDNIDKITKEIINFWEQIKNNKFFETINQNANKITKYINSTTKIFNEIDSELNFRNENFLMIYQRYLSDVIFDEELANGIKERLLQKQKDNLHRLKIENKEITTVIPYI